MLEQLKVLLDIEDAYQDDVLLTLLDVCTQEFCDYCRRKDFEKFEPLIINMAVFRYNSLGNEGLKSEDYSGVGFTYSTDYPDNIQRQLRNLRKVQMF